MKTTVTYKGPESEKLHRAINDVKSYISEDHFNRIIDEMRKVPLDKRSFSSFQFMMSFAGVQGYPCIAIWWYAYNELPTITTEEV
jgi:hypothetical protein